jgi:hypothetical protein
MDTNIGKLDSYLRFIVAIVLSTLAYNGFFPAILAVFFQVIAVVLLVTSIIGFCPLYSLLGIRSCQREE